LPCSGLSEGLFSDEKDAMAEEEIHAHEERYLQKIAGHEKK